MAAERDLVLDDLGAAPYAVGSTIFTTVPFSAELDVPRYLEGLINSDGTVLYVDNLLAFDDARFTFQLAVPADSAKYGELPARRYRTQATSCTRQPKIIRERITMFLARLPCRTCKDRTKVQYLRTRRSKTP
jgi:hypothetical protein